MIIFGVTILIVVALLVVFIWVAYFLMPAATPPPDGCEGDGSDGSIHDSIEPVLIGSVGVPERFTREEAEGKLGHRVRSGIELNGILAGAAGRVMEIDEIEKNGFDLIIEWDSRIGGKFQHDWFSKDRYERCLIDEVD